MVLDFLKAFYKYFHLFQAEDGIRDCLLSRGLGDVYKRQKQDYSHYFRFHLERVNQKILVHLDLDHYSLSCKVHFLWREAVKKK